MEYSGCQSAEPRTHSSTPSSFLPEKRADHARAGSTSWLVGGLRLWGLLGTHPYVCLLGRAGRTRGSGPNGQEELSLGEGFSILGDFGPPAQRGSAAPSDLPSSSSLTRDLPMP